MMGQSRYPVSCYHVYGNGSLEALRRGMVLLAMVAVGFVICCLSIIFATSQLDFQNSVSLGESGVARPRPLGVTSFAWRRPTVSFRYDASGRCGKFNSICNLKRQRQILQAHGEKQATSSLQEMTLTSMAERQAHLESQAMQAIKFTVENYEHPVFPCALIAGDVVLLELLNRLGYLSTNRVQIMFVDTFYLFNETIDFMKAVEKRYNFKANWFHAEGFESKSEIEEKYGVDFWKDDLKLYDGICKVEPYQRGLQSLAADGVITGRRRDHGFDRAFLDIYEPGDGRDKINPLAYWTFEDVWNYLESEKIAYHPLHDKGYPSIGDAKDTVPVPRSKWFEYAGERLGRFNGLTNDDGSTKTECGIHLPHASNKKDSLDDEKGGGGGLTINIL